MSVPTDQQLCEAAHRAYGRGCSQSHCKARGDDRGVCLAANMQAERDDESEGTWITARIWISDSEIKP